MRIHRRHSPAPLWPLLVLMLGASCASLPGRDPLTVDIAGIEPLPSEGMELRLAVRVRVQNPNDIAVEYSGAALSLDLNGRNLASGVSDQAGTVPRYGETVFTVPVTISAFDMARQVFGMATDADRNEVRYRVSGKLEGGLFGTQHFTDEGTFEMPPAANPAPR